MKNLSIQTKLMAGFGILIVLLLVVSVYAGYSAKRLNEKTDNITSHWMASIERLGEIDGGSSDARRKLILMNLRTTPEQMTKDAEAITAMHKAVDEAIDRYAADIDTGSYAAEADRQSDKQKLQNIAALWKNYSAQEIKIVQMIRSGQKEQAVTEINGASSKVYNEMNSAIETEKSAAKEGAGKAEQESETIYNSVLWTSGILGVLAMIIGLILASMIIRDIKHSVAEMLRVFELSAKGDLSARVQIQTQDEFGNIGAHYNDIMQELCGLIHKIQEMAQQLAAASEQLTANAEQSAQVTQQIAQSITGVAEAANTQQDTIHHSSEMTEQVSAGVMQAVGAAEQSLQQTRQGVDKAQEGNELVKVTIEQMKSIAATVEQSAEVVAKLGERSSEIGQIVDTISNIAGQTNLLSLNAAIEAARAGEHGKGFAVVAEEVRKLAEQSETAAQHIAGLIRSIQSETEQAVAAMQSGTHEVAQGTESVGSAGKAFADILSVVNNVNNGANSIADTMKQLQGSIRRIVESSEAVDRSARSVTEEASNVSAATEEQSASMEEIATGSRSLAELAQQMQESANKFTV